MTDTRELLPCPFCGGRAVFENLVIEAVIYCARCNARISKSHDALEDTGKGKVIAAWQARAQDNRCVELLEAAKFLLSVPVNNDDATVVAHERLRKAIAAFEGK